MPRAIDHRYQDPLDLIWLACARELGIAVERSHDVYASYDGAGTLTLSAREHFDADDSLAQLIFHELCHALVAGPDALTRPDWGMENRDARDLEQEHACHRVQAALADRHGLRGLFAVTTDHRAYWDALPIAPLGPGDDPAIARARSAFARAREAPWAGPIERALARTAELAATLREIALPPDSLWRQTRPLHPTGFPLGVEPERRCGGCAWSYARGERLSCRQARPRRAVAAGQQACVRFEPKFDAESCARCGACCREAFDRVELRAREHDPKRRPALARLVVVDGFGPHLPRPGGPCVALACADGRYRCRIYEERPRACADFEIGGDACLTARRRVGLSA